MNRSNLILILSALIIAVIANSIYIVDEKEKALVTPVSYTHLTLPTKA